jgi:TPP-dependent pyruvate/acetoin dehydrogenase alpha subunit
MKASGDIGDFHETFNMAAIWDLLVIFILENNHTPSPIPPATPYH